MLKELFVSLQQNIKLKTTNPFLGSFIIVWFVRNWKFIYSLFTLNTNIPISERFRTNMGRNEMLRYMQYGIKFNSMSLILADKLRFLLTLVSQSLKFTIQLFKLLNMKPRLALIFVISCFIIWACEEDHSPKIKSLQADSEIVEIKNSISITCKAEDPDGNWFFFTWEASSGIICGTGSTVTWTAFTNESTCQVSCTVTDGDGNQASKSISIQVTDPGTQVGDFNFLVNTRDGIVLIDSSGNSSSFMDANNGIEVYNDHLFVMKGWTYIEEYDRQGNSLNSTIIPDEVILFIDFTVLPDSRFAIYDNINDSIYFINSNGDYLGAVSMLTSNWGSAQITNGIVVDNNLIFSENGDKQILKVDLSSYEVSVFKDINKNPWIGAIDFDDGIYYICQNITIWAFTECESETIFLICDIRKENISGIVVVDDFAYVTVNFDGKIYKVNVFTGESEIFSEGLNYPEDIELW